MSHFHLALLTGGVIGVLDVIPMIAQRLGARSCISAFLLFFFSSVIVFHSDMPYLPWWADGMAVTLMMAIPVLFSLVGKERKSTPMILLNALIFGFLISLSERYMAQLV